MNWSTVQARSTYISELGSTLRCGTIEVPVGLRHPWTAPTSDFEKSLALATNFIAGVPGRHVMTFTRWQKIRETIASRFADPSFVRQVRSSVGGNDEAALLQFDQDLLAMRSTLDQVADRIPDVQTYAACILRNIILNSDPPHFKNLGPLLGLSAYANSPSIVQSIYSDLSQYDEITLRLWAIVTVAAFDEGILPSAKAAFEQLLTQEIPFSGTPKIKPLTTAQAIKWIRGCGLCVLSGAALGASHSFATGSIMAALSVSGGGVGAALLFFAFGSLLPQLEEATVRGFQRYMGAPSPPK
jgi:hypothetical protein